MKIQVKVDIWPSICNVVGIKKNKNFMVPNRELLLCTLDLLRLLKCNYNCGGVVIFTLSTEPFVNSKRIYFSSGGGHTVVWGTNKRFIDQVMYTEVKWEFVKLFPEIETNKYITLYIGIEQ